MAECCGISSEQQQLDKKQRQLLWTVLILNAIMFVVEFVAGWVAESSGLIADSLDMLADALVYSVSLYAVGKALRYKANAALLNGILQLSLASLVIIDVIKRYVVGSNPDADTMLSIATLALVVNIACFLLLYSSRNGDINIRASWICSRNDMLMNTGVIFSALLVGSQQQAWPDLLIALVIALFVAHSAVRIIGDARKVKRGELTDISSCCG
jgi:cation diffusion facilitator family transporter